MQISATVKVFCSESLRLQLQLFPSALEEQPLFNNFQLMMAVCFSLNEESETIGQVPSSPRGQVKVCVWTQSVSRRCCEWERTKGAQTQCGHS